MVNDVSQLHYPAVRDDDEAPSDPRAWTCLFSVRVDYQLDDQLTW